MFASFFVFINEIIQIDFKVLNVRGISDAFNSLFFGPNTMTIDGFFNSSTSNYLTMVKIMCFFANRGE